MSYVRQTLLVFKRIFIVIGIAVAFGLGLMGAIYLSLRSSETRVPDVIGKDRMSAESTISDAGLNFRVRATRPTAGAKPDTVLIQLPHAGEIVKVGQTVAVDISRSTGNEATTPENTNANTNASPENKTSNANSEDNTNDKPKKKPTNRNTNANRTTNNLNANRPATPLPANSNSTGNDNRAPRNSNNNRRAPAAAPTP